MIITKTAKSFYFLVIAAELVAVVFLSVRVYQKFYERQRVLGLAGVSPIKKDALVFPDEAGLKNYYEFTPGQTVEEQPEWLSHKVKYTINSDSLNERSEYQAEKPPGTFRIVTLGDSFTFGLFVNTRENWTEVLEDTLNRDVKCENIEKFEVINLGMPGYDVQYIVNRYKLRGYKYQPDLIIWLESGTGLSRLNEFTAPRAAEYDNTMTDEERAEIRKNGVYHAGMQKALEELGATYGREGLWDIVKEYWHDFLIFRGDTKVLVATLSELAPWLKPWQVEQLSMLVRKYPNTFFDDEGVPNLGPKERLADDHPNPKGHKLIAQRIFSYITGNAQIIPCEKPFRR